MICGEIAIFLKEANAISVELRKKVGHAEIKIQQYMQMHDAYEGL